METSIRLTSMLLDSVLDPWPTIAFWRAIGLLYTAYGGLAWIGKRITRSKARRRG